MSKSPALFRWIASVYIPKQEGWFFAGPTVEFQASSPEEFANEAWASYMEARDASFGWDPVDQVWHFPTLQPQVCLLRKMKGRKRWSECWWLPFTWAMPYVRVGDQDTRWGYILVATDEAWIKEQAPQLWQTAHNLSHHYKLPFGIPATI